MKSNIILMKSILKSTSWTKNATSASSKVQNRLDELLTIVQEKDATRVDAGHTHLELAISELRAAVFGF